MTSLDSFRCCKTLKVGSKSYAYFSLPIAERNGLKGISRLPFSMKVLLENLLRNEDGRTVTKDDIKAFAEWLKTKTSDHEFAFRPARVLMQDFTGVPAVVDLAAMRDAMKALGGDPKKINPQVPVDLVIDHSVAVTFFGNNAAFKKNVEEEYRQNQERYQFLKWAQRSFDNFSVVPPGTGICHQVNLEYLSRVVFSRKGKVKVDGKETDDGRRLPRHAGRNRLAYHHGERPLGARLGRRRHRSRGGDAWPAALDGAAGGDRLQTHRQDEGRRHRHRSRAHGHRDAAQARRGRQVRRVLRSRPDASLDRRPRDARQHGAGIWRYLRFLADRRRYDSLSQGDQPSRRGGVAGCRLCQGAGHVPCEDHARSDVHRRAQARSRAPSSPRSPDPSVRRIGSRSRMSSRASPPPWTRSSTRSAS